MLSKLRNDHDYNLGSDLFYLIMEACMQSISFADSQPVYETLTKLGAVADYRVKLVHFDHQRESLKQRSKQSAKGGTSFLKSSRRIETSNKAKTAIANFKLKQR